MCITDQVFLNNENIMSKIQMVINNCSLNLYNKFIKYQDSDSFNFIQRFILDF